MWDMAARKDGALGNQARLISSIIVATPVCCMYRRLWPAIRARYKRNRYTNCRHALQQRHLLLLDLSQPKRHALPGL